MKGGWLRGSETTCTFLIQHQEILGQSGPACVDKSGQAMEAAIALKFPERLPRGALAPWPAILSVCSMLQGKNLVQSLHKLPMHPGRMAPEVAST